MDQIEGWIEMPLRMLEGRPSGAGLARDADEEALHGRQ